MRLAAVTEGEERRFTPPEAVICALNRSTTTELVPTLKVAPLTGVAPAAVAVAVADGVTLLVARAVVAPVTGTVAVGDPVAVAFAGGALLVLCEQALRATRKKKRPALTMSRTALRSCRAGIVMSIVKE